MSFRVSYDFIKNWKSYVMNRYKLTDFCYLFGFILKKMKKKDLRLEAIHLLIFFFSKTGL